MRRASKTMKSLALPSPHTVSACCSVTMDRAGLEKLIIHLKGKRGDRGERDIRSKKEDRAW